MNAGTKPPERTAPVKPPADRALALERKIVVMATPSAR
jgi:hypothetical protein